MTSRHFQQNCFSWVKRCFGTQIATSSRERGRRFMEEALETVQAVGLTKEDIVGLMDRVYDRAPGELKKEIGQTLFTLGTLAEANNIDMLHEARWSLRRAEAKPDDYWRDRHDAKVKAGIAEK